MWRERISSINTDWKWLFLSWMPLEVVGLTAYPSLHHTVSSSVSMYMADGLFVYWLRKNKLNWLQAIPFKTIAFLFASEHGIFLLYGTWETKEPRLGKQSADSTGSGASACFRAGHPRTDSGRTHSFTAFVIRCLPGHWLARQSEVPCDEVVWSSDYGTDPVASTQVSQESTL